MLFGTILLFQVPKFVAMYGAVVRIFVQILYIAM